MIRRWLHKKEGESFFFLCPPPPQPHFDVFVEFYWILQPHQNPRLTLWDVVFNTPNEEQRFSNVEVLVFSIDDQNLDEFSYRDTMRDIYIQLI